MAQKQLSKTSYTACDLGYFGRWYSPYSPPFCPNQSSSYFHLGAAGDRGGSVASLIKTLHTTASKQARTRWIRSSFRMIKKFQRKQVLEHAKFSELVVP